MEKFHFIKTHIDPALITKANNHFQVKVYWEVDFNEDLVPYLSNKKFQHNPDLLKRGVGELIVEVPCTKFPTDEEVIAFAEGNAVLFLVEKTGLNVFGIERGVKVQKLQLDLHLSSPLAADLIRRDDKLVAFLQDSPRASLLGLTDYMAAYFYGSKVTNATEFAWADAVKSGQESAEYFNAVRAASVRKLLEINSPIGILHMTYRTVQEFLAMPLNKELVEVKGQVFARPYESAVERVLMAKSIVPDENDHMKKLTKKFPGKGVRSLFVKTPPTFIDLVPLPNMVEPHFMVIGYRALYSQETLERLQEGGFTYHNG